MGVGGAVPPEKTGQSVKTFVQYVEEVQKTTGAVVLGLAAAQETDSGTKTGLEGSQCTQGVVGELGDSVADRGLGSQ